MTPAPAAAAHREPYDTPSPVAARGEFSPGETILIDRNGEELSIKTAPVEEAALTS
jgi:hypothetical protein